jgi:hypothetical protein
MFVFLGVPLLAVLMLGERSCDMGIGPPCSIGWGWAKLITAILIMAICTAIGLLVAFLGRRRDRDRANKAAKHP